MKWALELVLRLVALAVLLSVIVHGVRRSRRRDNVQEPVMARSTPERHLRG
jgi:hypothetical protein